MKYTRTFIADRLNMLIYDALERARSALALYARYRAVKCRARADTPNKFHNVKEVQRAYSHGIWTRRAKNARFLNLNENP